MGSLICLNAFCSGSFGENVKEKPYLADDFWAESACDGSEGIEWENVVGGRNRNSFFIVSNNKSR